MVGTLPVLHEWELSYSSWLTQKNAGREGSTHTPQQGFGNLATEAWQPALSCIALGWPEQCGGRQRHSTMAPRLLSLAVTHSNQPCQQLLWVSGWWGWWFKQPEQPQMGLGGKSSFPRSQLLPNSPHHPVEQQFKSWQLGTGLRCIPSYWLLIKSLPHHAAGWWSKGKVAKPGSAWFRKKAGVGTRDCLSWGRSRE